MNSPNILEINIGDYYLIIGSKKNKIMLIKKKLVNRHNILEINIPDYYLIFGSKKNINIPELNAILLCMIIFIVAFIYFLNFLIKN